MAGSSETKRHAPAGKRYQPPGALRLHLDHLDGSPTRLVPAINAALTRAGVLAGRVERFARVVPVDVLEAPLIADARGVHRMNELQRVPRVNRRGCQIRVVEPHRDEAAIRRELDRKRLLSGSRLAPPDQAKRTIVEAQIAIQRGDNQTAIGSKANIEDPVAVLRVARNLRIVARAQDAQPFGALQAHNQGFAIRGEGERTDGLGESAHAAHKLARLAI